MTDSSELSRTLSELRRRADGVNESLARLHKLVDTHRDASPWPDVLNQLRVASNQYARLLEELARGGGGEMLRHYALCPRSRVPGDSAPNEDLLRRAFNLPLMASTHTLPECDRADEALLTRQLESLPANVPPQQALLRHNTCCSDAMAAFAPRARALEERIEAAARERQRAATEEQRQQMIQQSRDSRRDLQQSGESLMPPHLRNLLEAMDRGNGLYQSTGAKVDDAAAAAAVASTSASVVPQRSHSPNSLAMAAQQRQFNVAAASYSAAAYAANTGTVGPQHRMITMSAAAQQQQQQQQQAQIQQQAYTQQQIQQQQQQQYATSAQMRAGNVPVVMMPQQPRQLYGQAPQQQSLPAMPAVAAGQQVKQVKAPKAKRAKAPVDAQQLLQQPQQLVAAAAGMPIGMPQVQQRVPMPYQQQQPQPLQQQMPQQQQVMAMGTAPMAMPIRSSETQNQEVLKQRLQALTEREKELRIKKGLL